MADSDASDSTKKAVMDEAMAWVVRLASGEATAAEAEALRRWRDAKPEHRRAFAEAKLLWQMVGSAADEVRPRYGTSHTSTSARGLGRRAFIGGALAASAAGAAYVIARPPFDAWPSYAELAADYRTRTGEQRQVALRDEVSLVLNTQTSIGIHPAERGAARIELIAGEAMVTANAAGSAPVDIRAGDGEMLARTARFNVRRDHADVCVTCLEGAVEVRHLKRTVIVLAGYQLNYNDVGLGDVAVSDIAATTAWQHGQLIFRHEPFSKVIAEVNRYRPGRIILLNRKLGERDVVATFYLSRIDGVVEKLAQVFGARVRYLPGGVVLVS